MRKRSLTVLLIITVISGIMLSSVPAAAAPSQIVRWVDTQEKVVSLTFDAGSDLGHTYTILDILRRNGVTATFFLTGRWVDAYPQAARDVLAAGHEVANHTYSHPDLTTLDSAAINDQLGRTEQSIRRATGSAPLPLFRPPFGAYNQGVLETVGSSGYRWTAMWTVDSLDWKEIPASQIRTRVLDSLRPGAIILMHVGSGTQTPQALELLIKDFRDRGYRMAATGQLLGIGETGQIHVVTRGDTLWGISQRYGVSVDELARTNGISNPGMIYEGQRLQIPVATRTIPHTVQQGDTMYSIARQYGTTVAELTRLNGISDPNRIYAGQIIRVPAGSTRQYVVASGDTLWSIASRHGTTVAAITAANAISNPDLIYVGQVLAIPA